MSNMAGRIASIAVLENCLAADCAAHQLHILVEPFCEEFAPMHVFLQKLLALS